jgi:competence protein ComEC
MTKIKLILIFIVLGLGWWGIKQALTTDKTRVIFCDVGQGDGAIVVKGSMEIVIDTGFDNGKMLRCLGEHLPFWDKKIEVVIISHWDSDHSGALASIMKYYKIDSLVSSQKPLGDFEQNVYSSILSQGDYLKVGEISFEVVSPEESGDKTNDGSLVGILSYRNLDVRNGLKPFRTNMGMGINILFMGDASSNVEQRLVWRGILDRERFETVPYKIIKISHHGSGEATSKELLEAIKPDLAIISVGKDNKFGHPTKEVLDRLEAAGVEVRRTDREGDLVVELN